MARIHGTDARVYVDQYNLSGRTNSLDLEMGTSVDEVTAFEETGDAQAFIDSKMGRHWSAKLGAFADYTSTEVDTIVHGLLGDGGADHRIGLYFDGAAAGSKGYEGLGILTTKQNSIPVGPQRLDFAFTGRGGKFIAEATKLNEATVVTGTGTQTGQQHRRTPAVGDVVMFVVRVTAVSGSGSATFRLEYSADGSTGWTTVTTLSAMTAVGAQHAYTTAAGAIGPYYRLNTTAFSGFTNVTVRVSVGLIKNT